jgi:2-hydroxy-6-oxo-octa-2,4-dienoate hydrolase
MTQNPAIGRTLDAAGHRTNYHDAGKGPPLLMLHGSGPGVSAWSNWAGFWPRFTDTHRVVAPDIAGFGFTEMHDGTVYDIKLWVRHLLAIMDALEIERAPMLGNSFGGALALATALHAPERVERLILLGTPCGEFTMSEGLRAGWLYEPSVENMTELMRLFPYDPSIVTPDLVQSRYETSARPGAQAAFRKLVPKPSEDGSPTPVRGLPVKALATLPHRALIVHGREDRVVPVELAIQSHRALQNSDLHLFGKCGHWVQVERGDALATLMHDFLDGPA